MSRIAACIEALQQQGRKALIPYIVAGDPNPEFTVPMMHQLVEQGADIIELGIPFSDPMAEGPAIQQAHERALAHNISLTNALAMVTEFRSRDANTPVVLMGYANPIEKMGHQQFAEQAVAAGVDGVLTVDLPPEEADDFNQVLKTVSIDTIFLVSPTTSDARIKSITEQATGYIYYVSLKGVTGAGHLDIDAVKQKVSDIKSMTVLPVMVGFGIKDAESASAISAVSEGVVVGSELIRQVVSLSSEGHQAIDAATLIGEMRQAMDK